MKRAALLLVLLTSSAKADELTTGDVYLIRADGWATPSCEKWHVDTSRKELTHRDGKLRDVVAYEANAISIGFTSFVRMRDDGTISADEECKLGTGVERLKDGWRIGSARWFSTKKACATALKKHERVGTTFGCPSPDDLPITYAKEFVQLQNLLASGGTMFTAPTCTRVPFKAGTPLNDDAKTVRMCSQDLTYELEDEGVALAGVRLYFDAKQCRAHERARATIASYLPLVASAGADAALPSCK
jgi:hypothetical protein